jgi:hypothetical protein
MVIGLAVIEPIASLAAVVPTKRTAGAEGQPAGGSTWATFKQADVTEERSSYAVFAARNAERERTAGSPAAAQDRSAASGRPAGCFGYVLGSEDGTVRTLEVCPGEGGDRGAAAEAFGISELRLTDPTTGEPLPPSAGGGEVVVVDPRALAERAAAALTLPAPVIRTSPAGEHIAQLPSWLWIAGDQWQPRSVAASAGPVTSTVTATPTRVTWDMGNGDRVDCDGPGRPYQQRFAGTPQATDCRYTYRHSSATQPGAAYDLTATITWDLTWTATGAPGGGSLGPVPMSATRPVRVAEVQALVQ